MGTNARKRRVFIKQLIFLVALVVAGWFGVGAVQSYLAERDLLSVHFELPNGQESPTYHLRVAKNEAQREQGLMYVRSEELSDNRGMVFVFPAERVQSFWMKNTPSPLDMIFLNKDRIVVGVVENAKPFSVEPRAVEKPSIYVVELLAGSARRDGIVTNAKLIPAADLPSAE